MKKLFLLSLLISLISPIKTFAGFPEGEKGFDLKKIEESFKLPCDEIGNDECIARAFGVGACTWVFGIKKGKESKEALRIADEVLIALMKGNNLERRRSICACKAQAPCKRPSPCGPPMLI